MIVPEVYLENVLDEGLEEVEQVLFSINVFPKLIDHDSFGGVRALPPNQSGGGVIIISVIKKARRIKHQVE
jgi:hypothetical protein